LAVLIDGTHGDGRFAAPKRGKPNSQVLRDLLDLDDSEVQWRLHQGVLANQPAA
jgi:hypothetical protein